MILLARPRTTRERYDALPQPIKDAYSYTEWLWLPDDAKAVLERAECEPDWTE